MINKYQLRIKLSQIYPNIDDWESKKADRFRKKLRQTKISELTWFEWFFFHPSAYTLMYYSTYIVNTAIFFIISLLFYVFFKWHIVTILTAISGLFFLYLTVKNLINYKAISQLTYFEVLAK